MESAISKNIRLLINKNQNKMKELIKEEKKKHFLYTLLATFKKRKYSDWADVGCYDRGGHYYLLQMSYRLDDNRKRFRQAKIGGFINDYVNRPEIFKNTLSLNK